MEEDNKRISLEPLKSISSKANELASQTKTSISSTSGQIKGNLTNVKNAIESKIKQNALDKLNPIFEQDIAGDEIRLERVIRFVNYDAKHDNDTCKGAIGFYEITKDRKLPTFYSKYASKLGLTFYPQLSESVYVADPFIAGKYIEINEYYNYMKTVRVNELTLIAQALGATSVSIKLVTKQHSKSSSKTELTVELSPDEEKEKEEKGKSKKSAKLATIPANNNETGFKKLGKNIKNMVTDELSLEGNAKARVEKKNESSETFEVWSKTEFKKNVWNSTPAIPAVVYFRNESDIASLIQMVVFNKSKVTTRKYRMSASTSSGMSLTEASSINGALKAIKCNIGLNFKKSAEKESMSQLEYTIVF